MTEREKQPFLRGYSDDGNSTLGGMEPDQSYVAPSVLCSKTRLLSYALTIVLTSMAWAIGLFIVTTTTMTKEWQASGSSLDPNSNYTATKLNITSNHHLLTCGNTTESARAQDCKYDILLNSWVPAPCYDSEFITEYTDDSSWDAFADEQMTVRLTDVETMSEMEFYYTSMRDHVNHCATLWKKQFWVH